MNLSVEILEQEHTAKNYFQWVKNLIDKVKENELGIDLIRLREGLCKELAVKRLLEDIK